MKTKNSFILLVLAIAIGLIALAASSNIVRGWRLFTSDVYFSKPWQPSTNKVDVWVGRQSISGTRDTVLVSGLDDSSAVIITAQDGAFKDATIYVDVRADTFIVISDSTESGKYSFLAVP